MGKDVRFEDGKTIVHVYAEDCKDAKEVKEEIEDIVREAITAGNPTRFWKHLLTYITIEADSITVEIRGYILDDFVQKGYRIW